MKLPLRCYESRPAEFDRQIKTKYWLVLFFIFQCWDDPFIVNTFNAPCTNIKNSPISKSTE